MGASETVFLRAGARVRLGFSALFPAAAEVFASGFSVEGAGGWAFTGLSAAAGLDAGAFALDA